MRECLARCVVTLCSVIVAMDMAAALDALVMMRGGNSAHLSPREKLLRRYSADGHVPAPIHPALPQPAFVAGHAPAQGKVCSHTSCEVKNGHTFIYDWHFAESRGSRHHCVSDIAAKKCTCICGDSTTMHGASMLIHDANGPRRAVRRISAPVNHAKQDVHGHGPDDNFPPVLSPPSTANTSVRSFGTSSQPHNVSVNAPGATSVPAAIEVKLSVELEGETRATFTDDKKLKFREAVAAALPGVTADMVIIDEAKTFGRRLVVSPGAAGLSFSVFFTIIFPAIAVPAPAPSATPGQAATPITTAAPLSAAARLERAAALAARAAQPSFIATLGMTLNVAGLEVVPNAGPSAPVVISPVTLPVAKATRTETLQVGTRVVLPAGRVLLAPAGAAQLLRVTKTVAGTKSMLLAGRSYEGSTWESAQPVLLDFSCPGTSGPGGAPLYTLPGAHSLTPCAVTIPDSADVYEIEAFDTSADKPSERATASRFLMRATFGPTRAEIDAFKSPIRYLKQQMAMKMTSHREHVRRRTNPRFNRQFSGHLPVGTMRPACSAGSRWNRFALTNDDIGEAITFKVDGPSKVVISVGGYERTTVPAAEISLELKKDYLARTAPTDRLSWHDARQYCRSLHRDLGVPNSKEDINLMNLAMPGYQGWIGLSDEAVEGDWKAADASAPFFSWKENEPNNHRGNEHCALLGADGLMLDNDCSRKMPFWCGPKIVGGTTLKDLLQAPLKVCSVQENVGAEVRFGVVGSRGECLGVARNPTVQASPRSRIVVKGGKVTHVNADVIVLDAAVDDVPCARAPLHGPLFGEFYGKLFVADRRLQLLENTVKSPAVKAVKTSRALRSECPNVKKTFLNAHTCVVGRESCASLSFTHANVTLDTDTIRKFFSTSGKIVLEVTGLEAGHEDEGNVFDFTHFALSHPSIAARAHAGETTLPWSAKFADFRGKWTFEGTKNNKQNEIALLGLRGTTVDFANLPIGVQVEGIARAVGAISSRSDASFESCGSPGEVANDPKLGHHYFMLLGAPGADNEDGEGKRDRDAAATMYKNDGAQAVWATAALRAPDQLRQRVAWALSQIFVVNEAGVPKSQDTELWINYYDIFVRNAFGNYRDIMREVSYSPLMATMLTYLFSRSADRTGFFPDENFAREVMQLFSIGLWKLHPNGTRYTDSHGRDVPSYNMHNIEALARAWTGFQPQPSRSNYEHINNKYTQNIIDPMKIKELDRDQEPKIDLNGGFIGDGYPLCTDLPADSFLRKGARYRYIGNSGLPDKTLDPAHYMHDFGTKGNHGLNVTRLNLRPGASALYRALCNAVADGQPCRFQSEVTLSATLQCTGHECGLDSVRIVQLPNAAKHSDGTPYHVRFEYIRPACVEMAFPEQQTLVTSNHGFERRHGAAPMCVDARSAVAGVACCTKTVVGPWEAANSPAGAKLVVQKPASCQGYTGCNPSVTKHLARWNIHIDVTTEDRKGSGHVDANTQMKVVGSNGNEFPIYKVSHFAWKGKYFMIHPVRTNAEYDAKLLDQFNALFPVGTTLTLQKKVTQPANLDHAFCQSEYSNEKVRFATAKARCESIGRQVCDWQGVHPERYAWHPAGQHGCEFWDNYAYYWSTGARTCGLQAQINEDGLVSFVDKIDGTEQMKGNTRHPTQRYAADSLRFFRVHWDTPFPVVDSQCGTCDVHGATCLCDVTVTSKAVFTAVPSRAAVLAQLKVGAFDPAVFSDKTHVSYRLGDVVVHNPKTSPRTISMQTVFEVVSDESAHTAKRYFKNVRSSVQLKGSELSFRNPPSFHTRGNPTIRDAEYETEAVLDAYFRHTSVAPFVSSLMIQRFVTSNPSPRYVESVSTAFARGRYKGFGTGERGDLAATIAAVMLDREASSAVLDKDADFGGVREPLLKYIHVMRSLGFKSAPGAQEVVLRDRIGQFPYRAESVFNFFQFDYVPAGPVTKAQLVAPEAALLTAPDILGFLNGAHSLIRYGLTHCDHGLGYYRSPRHCNIDVLDNKHDPWRFTAGNLTFTAKFNGDVDNTAKSVVRELDIILTGGRLNAHSLKVVESAFVTELDKPFILVQKARTFADSRKYCQSLGRDLVSIHSQAELDAVNALGNFNVWVGVTDANTEQDWRNVDGTPAFDAWRRNPRTGKVNEGIGGETLHNGEGEDCALLANDGTFRDYKCSHKMYSVCGKMIRPFAASDLARATKLAQQLIVTTPEFHVTGSADVSATRRDAPKSKVNSRPAAARRRYKAIVYLTLDGGADSFNMLVPHSGCTPARDMYAQYKQVRGNVALEKDQLLPIDAAVRSRKSKQVCSKFGLHPKLPTLQKLYNENDAAWFANVGPLVVPTNRHTWKKVKRPEQLFGHRSQRRLTQNVDASHKSRTNGVLGRMIDSFVQGGVGTGAYSLWGQQATAITAASSATPAFDVVGLRGVPLLSGRSQPLMPAIAKLMSNVSKSPFAETWAHQLNNTLSSTKQLNDVLKQTSLATSFPADKQENRLGRQMKQVATLIKANTESLHNERDVFYVSLGGFDAHSMVESQMETSLAHVDEALSSFAAEMKAQGMWDQVTIMQTSEFGRTLTSNGDGTDHAWGGNYFVAGGAVRGGQILGEFPNDLSPSGDQILHRGRVVPSTSWDQVWAGVGEWFGVDSSALKSTVLPNYGNFPHHFTGADIFEHF